MLPITYGTCTEANYLQAGDLIVQDIEKEEYGAIVYRINNTFFEGGNFDPKSLSTLASILIPIPPLSTMVMPGGIRNVRIGTQISISAILGYVECIPVIGSVLAVIFALGHLYCMVSSYNALKQAAERFKTIEKSDFNIRRGACTAAMDDVFTAAVAVTVYRNHIIGSALAIIPLLKPAIRIYQWASYNPPR